MATILINASKSSEANSLVSEVETGTLWGISLGTTTKSAANSSWVVVECTATRAFDLCNAAPEDSDIPVLDVDPPSFTDSDDKCKVWYLRGKIA